MSLPGQPGGKMPIPDAELTFALQQLQGAVIADFDRLVRGSLDPTARKHLAKHLVTVAEDLLRPMPVVIDGRPTTVRVVEDDTGPLAVEAAAVSDDYKDTRRGGAAYPDSAPSRRAPNPTATYEPARTDTAGGAEPVEMANRSSGLFLK